MSHQTTNESDTPPPADDLQSSARRWARQETLTQPAGSLWPVVLAAGITLLLFGILTSVAFSAAGLAVTAAGIVGWIRELRDET